MKISRTDFIMQKSIDVTARACSSPSERLFGSFRANGRWATARFFSGPSVQAAAIESTRYPM